MTLKPVGLWRKNARHTWLDQAGWYSRVGSACLGIASLLAPAPDGYASAPTGQVHFSGKIVASTGSVPSGLAAFADCDDGRARIQGKVEEGVYKVDLPAHVGCGIFVGNWDWASRPLSVADAAYAMARPVLVYPRNVPEPEIGRELIEMENEDQAARGRAPQSNDAASVARLKAADTARQRRLAEIVAAKGWPTDAMVGWKAARAAWTITQHADQDLAFQKQALAFMQKEARDNGALDIDIAYLSDRIATAEERAQPYGTQLTLPPPGKPCEVAFQAMDDREKVEERRRMLGLISLDAYRNMVRAHAGCGASLSAVGPATR